MAKLAQKFKEDLDIGYKQRNSKRQIKKVNLHSKRLTQKCMQDCRKTPIENGSIALQKIIRPRRKKNR